MALPTSSKCGFKRKISRLQQRAAMFYICLTAGCGLLLSGCENAENINTPQLIDDPFIIDNVAFSGVLFKLEQPDDPSSDRVFNLNLQLEQEATIDTSVTPPLVKLTIHHRRSPGSLLDAGDSLARYWLDEFRLTTDFMAADGIEVTSQGNSGTSATRELPYICELIDWKQERSYKVDSGEGAVPSTLRMTMEDFRGDMGGQDITRLIIVNTEVETTVNNQRVKINGKFEIDYARK